MPAEAETDLRKIRDFVSNHLEEIGQVPLSNNDNPLQRILERVSAIDVLIGKRNDHIENHLYTMMIRIISIFLLIVTLGFYNYKNSFRIDPILWLAIEKLSSFLNKADSLLWTEKQLPDEERLLVEQNLIDSFKNQDGAQCEAILKEHPQLQTIITEMNVTRSKEIVEIETIAKRDNFVAFYRSGPTASLSMFAECPSGIQIYGKKFSCIASAFEYRRCETAGHSKEELEKFPSLGGEEAFAYGKTLTKETNHWHTGNIATSLDYKAMEEIVIAKYAQNRDMLKSLTATGDADLIFHAPEGSKEGFWSDWGDGSGRNEFGLLLEKVRSLALRKEPPKGTPAQDKILKHQGSFLGNPSEYEVF